MPSAGMESTTIEVNYKWQLVGDFGGGFGGRICTAFSSPSLWKLDDDNAVAVAEKTTNVLIKCTAVMVSPHRHKAC